MKTYFSTFISGFDEVIKRERSKVVRDVKIKKIYDGLIVYETGKSIDAVSNIHFFNNSYILIKTFEDTSLKDAALQVLKNKNLITEITNELRSLGKTIRIIFSDENQITKIDKEILSSLEDILSKGISLDRANLDTEVWFLKRSEGEIFLGLRITKLDESQKHLKKGQLRKQLAHLLCLMSEPTKEDVFLDPFAGTGAIVEERVKHFPYKKVFISDNDKQVFRRLQERFGKIRNVVLGRWDARKLSSLTDNSIDKVVTDPPWGFYKDESEDLGLFYSEMLKEFSRVLRSGGVAVILMGQKELFEIELAKNKSLSLKMKLDVLVSGKKAGVYKFLRK